MCYFLRFLSRFVIIIMSRKKCRILFILAVITVPIIYHLFFIENYFVWRVPNYIEIMCYDNDKFNAIEDLSSTKIRINKTLFFIETSCPKEGLPSLNARQACSIESAALMNPHLDVVLLFPSPVNTSDLSSIAFLSPLMKYDNFKVRHIRMNSFFEDTPLSFSWRLNWAGLKTSYWPQSHASDILRYTLLWKYGGTYLDLDVVLLQSFGNLSNFAGAESATAVAAGVLSLGHGTHFADLCIKDLKYNFKGYDWGNNGPGVITRVAKFLCSTNDVKKMDSCSGFTVFKPLKFYPIRWQDWKLYFSENDSSSTMDRLNDSIGVHVWNSLSHNYPVRKGSRQPYSLLAAKQCPNVYEQVDQIF